MTPSETVFAVLILLVGASFFAFLWFIAGMCLASASERIWRERDNSSEVAFWLFPLSFIFGRVGTPRLWPWPNPKETMWYFGLIVLAWPLSALLSTVIASAILPGWLLMKAWDGINRNQ